MEVEKMRTESILVLAVLCLAFLAGSGWADPTPTYLSIENIGTLPIWGVKVTFDIAPRGSFTFPDLSYDFGVIFRSSAYPWPPLDEPLTPFDRDDRCRNTAGRRSQESTENIQSLCLLS
jgi:hypothetical protein